jgi:hypothetical protein
VRVYAGAVSAATITGAGSHVYQARGVVDAAGRAVGDYKMSSAAGWASVGAPGTPALEVGVPAEQAPRLSVGTDGSLAWAGAGPAAAVLQRMRANRTQWDPPPLRAGGVARTTVALPGARAGDVVAAAHSGSAAAGMQEVALSAVVGPGNGTVCRGALP